MMKNGNPSVFRGSNRENSRMPRFCRIKTKYETVAILSARMHTDSLFEKNWDGRVIGFFSRIYCTFRLPHTRLWWTHFGLRASEESGENEEPQTSLAEQVIFTVDFRISLFLVILKR